MGSSSADCGVLRSISLPSRLDPESINFEAELNRLKSWESSSSIQVGLVRLAELYNCMAEAIQSPQTQQALNQNRNASSVEEALEGSVGLLDACGLAKDLISNMKQQVQDLQSVLRRRAGKDSSIEAQIQAYLCFRKKAKKDASKCLRSLKKMESNTGSSQDPNHHHHLVLKWLIELSAIAISVFRSLMVLLSEATTRAKAGGWSLVRKMMPKTGGSVASEKNVNEIGSLDFGVQCLYRGMNKNGGKVDAQMVHGSLERVDATMKDVEDGLDCVFRSLIHSRVALLNVLTP